MTGTCSLCVWKTNGTKWADEKGQAKSCTAQLGVLTPEQTELVAMELLGWLLGLWGPMYETLSLFLRGVLLKSFTQSTEEKCMLPSACLNISLATLHQAAHFSSDLTRVPQDILKTPALRKAEELPHSAWDLGWLMLAFPKR